ncbi:MAG: hypothetical protein R3E79_61330 [Caldilineaceae bacterium]
MKYARFAFTIAPLFLAVGILLWLNRPAPAASTMIDFEATILEPQEDRRTIDPYTDTASGIVFGAVDAVANGVVGIVKNSATSACVEPSDANQKLGTGVNSTQGSTVGQSGFAIRADFPTCWRRRLPSVWTFRPPAAPCACGSLMPMTRR